MNQPRYVGIDVAEEGFEVAADGDRETSHYAYTAAGIRRLLRQLAAMTVALICLEATAATSAGWRSPLPITATGSRSPTRTAPSASPTPAAA